MRKSVGAEETASDIARRLKKAKALRRKALKLEAIDRRLIERSQALVAESRALLDGEE